MSVDTSALAALATFLVLPVLSYLIVRRDQKIDAAEVKLHDMALGLVRLEVFASMVRDNITRKEFEQAMLSVNRGLEDIKDRLDNTEERRS